jgi:hypothetical protein
MSDDAEKWDEIYQKALMDWGTPRCEGASETRGLRFEPGSRS